MLTPIDFEKEYFESVSGMSAIEWAKSIAERVEREAIERCAKICEDNDEVTVLSTGKMVLEKKTSDNRNGLAYANGIRALPHPATQQKLMNKWKYFRECTNCHKSVSPRARRHEIEQYICTDCFFRGVPIDGPRVIEDDKKFKISCGPKISARIVYAKTWQEAFSKIIEQENPNVLSQLISIKEYGKPLMYALTELVLKIESTEAAKVKS